MSNHPINLAVRFFLELAALVAMGYWGWTQHDGVMRFVWAIGLPVVAATLWGVFRIEGEPGHAPVAVSGPVRLLFEIVYFGAAVGLLAASAQVIAAAILGGVTLAHYATSYDRVLRMIRDEKPIAPRWG